MIRFRNVGCGYSLLQPLFEPCLRQEVLSGGDLFFMNSVFYFTALRQRTDKFISSRGSDRRGDASPALLRLKFSSWCTLHCTGLFALHVKLDQHLQQKRVQKINFTSTMSLFCGVQAYFFQF